MLELMVTLIQIGQAIESLDEWSFQGKQEDSGGQVKGWNGRGWRCVLGGETTATDGPEKTDRRDTWKNMDEVKAGIRTSRQYLT